MNEAETKLKHHFLARQYSDVLTEIRQTRTPMEAFPESPVRVGGQAC